MKDEPPPAKIAAPSLRRWGEVVVFACSGLKDHWSSYSFRIIALQSGLYQCALQAIPFFAMWLQYSGLSDVQAGTVVACFRCGSMFGQLLGGFVGDALYAMYPLHGRQIFGQCSVAFA